MARSKVADSGRSGKKTQRGGSGRTPVARVPGGKKSRRKLPERVRERKSPLQDRSKQTVTAILQAAAELFANHGYAGTTTNKIASRAGVSIGSLYQYFPNKDAIVASMMARHLEAVEEVVRRGLADLGDPAVPLESALRSLLVGLVGVHEADPELARALSEDTALQALGRREHGKEDHDRSAHVEQVLHRRPDVREGDTALMALIVGRAVEGLTRWLVHEAPASLDRRAAIDEIVVLLQGYLAA